MELMQINTLNVIGEISFSPDYFRYIYIPVAIWLVSMFVLITALIIKYTFGKWTKENPNPFEGETLGLPRGVMRGIITLTLLFIVVLYETYNLYAGTGEEMFGEFVEAFKMMIAFYFGSKVAHHITSTDRHKAKIQKQGEVLMAQTETGVNVNSLEVPSVDEFVNADQDGSLG